MCDVNKRRSISICLYVVFDIRSTTRSFVTNQQRFEEGTDLFSHERLRLFVSGYQRL